MAVGPARRRSTRFDPTPFKTRGFLNPSRRQRPVTPRKAGLGVISRNFTLATFATENWMFGNAKCRISLGNFTPKTSN